MRTKTIRSRQWCSSKKCLGEVGSVILTMMDIFQAYILEVLATAPKSMIDEVAIWEDWTDLIRGRARRQGRERVLTWHVSDGLILDGDTDMSDSDYEPPL